MLWVNLYEGALIPRKLPYPRKFLVTRLKLHVTKCKTHCTKNEVFLLRISPLNVTKSAGSCGFGHIYWINLNGKLHFLCSETITQKKSIKPNMCRFDQNFKETCGNLKYSKSTLNRSSIIWYWKSIFPLSKELLKKNLSRSNETCINQLMKLLWMLKT